MNDLHPTPTRIALLRDVAASFVRWNERDGFTVRSTIVNARIRELERAGWIAIENVDYRQTIALTNKGRSVLKAAGATDGSGK